MEDRRPKILSAHLFEIRLVFGVVVRPDIHGEIPVHSFQPPPLDQPVKVVSASSVPKEIHLAIPMVVGVVTS
jgi:hypothetical protein